jgi:UDP-2,3-diacylglucosamine pyrophosphatase LpxH
VRVLQLGDFHDLWRESEHWWWDEDIRAMVSRQLKSHEPLFDLFRQLRTERLVGNHDKRLRTEKGKLAADPINEYFPVETIYPYSKSFRWGLLHRIDVIHADIFDKVETGFFSFLNPVGARLAEHNGTINIGNIDEWEHELEPPGTPDSATDRLDIEPAFTYDGDPNRTRYYANCQKYFREGNCDPALESLTPVATIIGHTHFPRIVINAPSPSYGLVDCGSWVNQSFAVGMKDGFWNGQLGVLTGNEIGILQIG